MRFENTPQLFGGGVGYGSYGEEKCDFCGTVHNEGATTDDTLSDESVSWTEFAGLQVCECCFERVEDEVLHRIGDILSWYNRILKRQREVLEARELALQKITR